MDEQEAPSTPQTLTGAVAESDGSEIMGEGFEMLRLDMDHGGPGEGNVILDVGLAHGLVHHGINLFHLGRGKREELGCGMSTRRW